VLIAGSSKTRPGLQVNLVARDLEVEVIALYEPHPCTAGLRALGEALREDPSRIIVLASPSAAEATVQFLHASPLCSAARWVAIGPATYRRLLALGIDPRQAAQAPAPTAEGIATAVWVLRSSQRDMEAAS
jgi:uroporphyrinogen-III synthase